MPRISIGLPCYNEAEFIEATLRSVLAQTEPDFELLICDNASTDGTLEIIKRIAAGDSRVVLHPAETNLGAPANFERALRKASAPLFMWMGAHDLLDKDYLKKLRLVLDADPTCVMAFADSIMIARDGSSIPGETKLNNPDLSSPDVVDRVKSLIWDMQRCDILHSLIRRDKIDPRILFQSRACDMVLLLDLALQGRGLRVPQLMFYRRKVREDEEPAARARRYVEAGLMNSSETLENSMIAVRDSHLDRLKGKGFSPPQERKLRAIINQGFKDRHRVPWDVTEMASWWEGIRLRSASAGHRAQIVRAIEQRIAAETRATNADNRRRIETELVSLLKENRKLQRELARLKR